MTGTLAEAAAFLDRGGPAMAVIAALSVLALALILWKLASFALVGVWRRRGADAADWDAFVRWFPDGFADPSAFADWAGSVAADREGDRTY